MSYALLILAMALVTFTPRFVPFFMASKLQLPNRVEQALGYVPIAVLTIIIFQTALYKEGNMWLSLNNPYIGASVAACLTALLQKRLFVTISVGMVSYVLLKFFLSPM